MWHIGWPVSAGGLVAVGVWLAVRALVLWRRNAVVGCRKCGYDMLSLVAGLKPEDRPRVCPECGTQAERVRDLRGRKGTMNAILLGCVLSVIGGAGLFARFGPPATVLRCLPTGVVVRLVPYISAQDLGPGYPVAVRLQSVVLTPGQMQALLDSTAQVVRGGDVLCSEAAIDLLVMGAPLFIPQNPPAAAASGVAGSLVKLSRVGRMLQLQVDTASSGMGDVLEYLASQTSADCVEAFHALAARREDARIARVLGRWGNEVTSVPGLTEQRMAASAQEGRTVATGSCAAIVKYLLLVLHDRSAFMRQLAADAIGSFGEKGAEAAAELHEVALKDSDRIVQQAASAAERAVRRRTPDEHAR